MQHAKPLWNTEWKNDRRNLPCFQSAGSAGGSCTGCNKTNTFAATRGISDRKKKKTIKWSQFIWKRRPTSQASRLTSWISLAFLASSALYLLQLYHDAPWGSQAPKQTQQNSCCEKKQAVVRETNKEPLSGQQTNWLRRSTATLPGDRPKTRTPPRRQFLDKGEGKIRLELQL